MVGLLGKKLGQTRFYTEDGKSVSVTIVQAGPNQVLQRKTTDKDGYEAVHLISNKSKDIYLIGGGSKNDFWGDMISFVLNKNILVGEDSEQGAALGVARLAMLATKEYKQSEVIKNMKIVRECFPSKIKSDQLQERYQTWKEIVNVNKPIAKDIMNVKYE